MNGIIYYTKIRDEYNGKNLSGNLDGSLLLSLGQRGNMGNRFLPCFQEFIIISHIPENM